MNIEQRLQRVFSQSYQIKRVAGEVEQIKDAKSKMGLEIRYISRENVHFAIIIEITKQKLKEVKRLAFLDKLEFKVVLKYSYPAEAPLVYFLNQNAIELGVNPFYNYLRSVCPEWGIKVSVMDIIKLVPTFLVQHLQKTNQFVGEPILYEFFQAQRLFSFRNCQVFPVKLMKDNATCNGMICIIDGEELVLLEQSNFSSCYINTDFIRIQQIFSTQKHKTKNMRAMLEIKRNGKRFGVEFSSDEYVTIIEAIVETMKTFSSHDKEKEEELDDSDEDGDDSAEQAKWNEQLHINSENIAEVESEILILHSLTESNPTSISVKQLVELLKKAVEYYSIKGDNRCQAHLASIQSIMNNQLLQTLLISEGETVNSSSPQQGEYQSITSYL